MAFERADERSKKVAVALGGARGARLLDHNPPRDRLESKLRGRFGAKSGKSMLVACVKKGVLNEPHQRIDMRRQKDTHLLQKPEASNDGRRIEEVLFYSVVD